MKYRILLTRRYKKAFKKLKNNPKALKQLRSVLELLVADAELPYSYKDHALVGNLAGLRELHVQPDLLLVYAKHENILVLQLIDIGSHGNIFG